MWFLICNYCFILFFMLLSQTHNSMENMDFFPNTLNSILDALSEKMNIFQHRGYTMALHKYADVGLLSWSNEFRADKFGAFVDCWCISQVHKSYGRLLWINGVLNGCYSFWPQENKWWISFIFCVWLLRLSFHSCEYKFLWLFVCLCLRVRVPIRGTSSPSTIIENDIVKCYVGFM